MQRHDSCLPLLKTAQVIRMTVVAKRRGDTDPIEYFFRNIGRADYLALLKNLARYDNCPELIQATQSHATAAIPELKHQLIATK